MYDVFRSYVSYFKYIIWFFMSYVGTAQNHIEGKTYEAVLSSHCKKTVGGGCTVDECCSLYFSQGTVQVRYYCRSDCVNQGVSRKTIMEHPEKEQQCAYTVRHKVLLIKNLKAYKKFEISDKQLLGFTHSGTDRILFKEVVNARID